MYYTLAQIPNDVLRHVVQVICERAPEAMTLSAAIWETFSLVRRVRMLSPSAPLLQIEMAPEIPNNALAGQASAPLLKMV